MSNIFPYCFGWIPDYPDIRDYSQAHEKVRALVNQNPKTRNQTISSSVDLRQWCSPVENQGDIGACTAHAVAGVVEYYERKSFGKHLDVSRLFLYKTTRNLMHLTGDTGAHLRSTIGALSLFGVPPEEYLPYDTRRFEEEPSAFCYAFAQNYQCLSYFRHDIPDLPLQGVLESVKSHLNSGIPSVFGFSVYQSIENSSADGCIPFPGNREKLMGGHAIAAVGYDDRKVVTHPQTKKITNGAFLIRNSWGKGWGEEGYGWLPYEYILKGLALDWWSILKQEWMDTGEFIEQ